MCFEPPLVPLKSELVSTNRVLSSHQRFPTYCGSLDGYTHSLCVSHVPSCSQPIALLSLVFTFPPIHLSLYLPPRWCLQQSGVSPCLAPSSLGLEGDLWLRKAGGFGRWSWWMTRFKITCGSERKHSVMNEWSPRVNLNYLLPGGQLVLDPSRRSRQFCLLFNDLIFSLTLLWWMKVAASPQDGLQENSEAWLLSYQLPGSIVVQSRQVQ